jgi:hypothetical protein
MAFCTLCMFINWLRSLIWLLCEGLPLHLVTICRGSEVPQACTHICCGGQHITQFASPQACEYHCSRKASAPHPTPPHPLPSPSKQHEAHQDTCSCKKYQLQAHRHSTNAWCVLPACATHNNSDLRRIRTAQCVLGRALSCSAADQRPTTPPCSTAASVGSAIYMHTDPHTMHGLKGLDESLG